VLSARRVLGFRGPDAALWVPTIATQNGEDLVPPSIADDLQGAAADSFIEHLPWSFYRTVRTVGDWLLASTLLIACAPVLAVIAVAIWVDSPGPAIFRQKRIGRNGKPFTIVKFRTLHVDAPSYSLKVAEHHAAITRIGKFLRRSGLDELPQLWNVVRGEMAIIGPRPEQLELISLYEPWQRLRLLVKPGITGWWQIHHRDGVPMHLNIDKDLYYIRHQGLRIDWLILQGTVKVLLGGISYALQSCPGTSPRPTSTENVASEGEGLETGLGVALATDSATPRR
jgi:lipopolysaccharide/colanic/teichoic acid biosynthesis glycosyltransferase